MIRSARLIFNPVAGQSDPEQDLEQIKTLLADIDLDIHLTTEDVGADQLAHEAIRDGVDAVIASGGDGTLSATATALIGTGIPLGIIARGTANAFANAMGIPTTIPEACEAILKGMTQPVDVAYCNGQPMVLLAGIGFEAETVERADRESKNRFGLLAYILAGLQQLRNLKRFEAEIETDDKIISLGASAITVANAAPATSVLAQGPAGLIADDGLLDMTIVAPASRAGALAATYHLLQSALNHSPAERDDIGYLRSRRFRIVTDPPQKVVVDGEMLGMTPITVECHPLALTLFVPPSEPDVPTEKLTGLPDLVIETKDSVKFE